MSNNLTERTMLHADLLLKRNSTLQNVSEYTGFSKQTILNDINDRLPDINMALYEKLRLKMAENKFMGQVRGGETNAKRAAKRAAKRTNKRKSKHI